jgi:tRNA(fMet)-specific endonuclease VapC
MGLILDTSILIAGERGGKSVPQIIRQIRTACGDQESALSSISIVELTHGIYRARTDADQSRRKIFVDEVIRDMFIHPVWIEVSQLAGRIEGEQAAKGISIAVQDLLIGATALHLGFDVVTLNVKHFQHIPGLRVLTI